MYWFCSPAAVGKKTKSVILHDTSSVYMLLLIDHKPPFLHDMLLATCVWSVTTEYTIPFTVHNGALLIHNIR